MSSWDANVKLKNKFLIWFFNAVSRPALKKALLLSWYKSNLAD